MSARRQSKGQARKDSHTAVQVPPVVHVPTDMLADDLPVFAEDNAPRGFVICEACGIVTPTNTYHHHIGRPVCRAEHARAVPRRTWGLPRGWVTLGGNGVLDSVMAFYSEPWALHEFVQVCEELRIPLWPALAGPGYDGCPVWAWRIGMANASIVTRRLCLVHARADVHVRRSVLSGLMLIGRAGGDQTAVEELMLGACEQA